MSTEETRQAIIEDRIDKDSLEVVLYDIEQVCLAKAQHIRENWQDEHAAEQWEAAAKYVATAQSVLPRYPGIIEVI